MKLILLADVKNLGYKDDVVEVKNGYGRNYLIPQGKAVIASDSALKQLEEIKRQRAHKLAKLKADAETLAQQLAAVKLTLSAKANEEGSIYGSINAAMIAEALEKLGYAIDRKQVEVGTVKTLGEHKAVVELHRDVKVEVPFEVVAEEA